MNLHARIFQPISNPQHALSLTTEGVLHAHLQDNQDLHVVPKLGDACMPEKINGNFTK
jgi:hypothetical protein